MKSLRDFINESKEEKVTSKSFTFNFEGIEGGEDVVKSLSELENDAVSIEDNKVTINVNADNASKLSDVIGVLDKISDIRSSPKNSSDETYAQKTKSLAEALSGMNEFISNLENGDDNKEGDNKEGDNKRDDKNKKEDE